MTIDMKTFDVAVDVVSSSLIDAGIQTKHSAVRKAFSDGLVILDIEHPGYRAKTEAPTTPEPTEDPLEARVARLEATARDTQAHAEVWIGEATERLQVWDREIGTHHKRQEAQLTGMLERIDALAERLNVVEVNAEQLSCGVAELYDAKDNPTPAAPKVDGPGEDDDYRPELMMDIDGEEITLHISSRFRIKREDFDEACEQELGFVSPDDPRLAPLTVSDEDVRAAREAAVFASGSGDQIPSIRVITAICEAYARRVNESRGLEGAKG